MTQEIRGKLETVTVPSMRTSRVNRYLKMNPDHAVVIGGLRQESGNDLERALIVVLQARPTFAIRDPSDQISAGATLAPGKVPLRVRRPESSGAERLWKIAGQMFEVGFMSNIGFDQKLGSVEESNSHATDQKFPYNAKVFVDKSDVHSGGGELFYPTSTLGQGSVVRVIREDPNGWLMIEPPEGSFSWVPARYVRPTTWGNGEVLSSNVVVYIGSSVSDSTNVWQVRMGAGETVEILGEQQIATMTGPKRMFKILPPAGEYRWIKSSAVISTDEPVRIVEPKQDTRFEVRVYPVADLVVHSVATAKASRVESPQERSDNQKLQASSIESGVEEKEKSNPNSLDSSNLIELIKTTVEPDSWDNGASPTRGGRMKFNANTMGLVIRQRPAVHDKIGDFLSQMRKSLTSSPVSTSVGVLKIQTAEHQKWLEDNVKFHPGPDGLPLALMSVGDIEKLIQQAKNQTTPATIPFRSEQFSLPIAGATGAEAKLQIQAVPTRDGQFIALSLAIKRGGESSVMTSRVIANGQTTLLDVSGFDAQKPNAAVLEGHSPEEQTSSEKMSPDQAGLKGGRVFIAITPSVVDEAKFEIE